MARADLIWWLGMGEGPTGGCYLVGPIWRAYAGRSQLGGLEKVGADDIKVEQVKPSDVDRMGKVDGCMQSRGMFR